MKKISKKLKNFFVRAIRLREGALQYGNNRKKEVAK